MSSQIDNILIQVRSELQLKGIKLWLEPYYVENIGSVEAEMEKLAKEFSVSLNIQIDYCLAALNELQSNAIEKLKARQEFQTTGVATLKVKAVHQPGGSKLLTINIRLTDLGEDLQTKVAEELKISKSQIKLISSGRVVKSEQILSQQGIGNNQQIMALVVQTPKDNEAEMYDKVRKVRDDAALLLESKDHSFLRMEDQDGNAIHLPPNEKKAIMMALALHEKGRASLQREKYEEALLFFLEADEEFSLCNSNILESVDNYALLNLDIVWCYLCLKSVTQLPDAQRRLYICEENFRRTYGDNMDRVLALKGSSENEKALMMRLHLLQAVTFFHQNRRNEARGLLMLAETELRNLKVDEGALTTLVEMGYSPGEARIALRSCGGVVDQAVAFIIDRREKKKNARKKAKEELNLNKQLSNTDDNWVNPRTLSTLIEMGFQKELAVAALKHSKNDLRIAMEMLENNIDALKQEANNDIVANEDLIQEIVKIGFDPEMARLALEEAFNNSQQAVELLLKMQNDGEYEKNLMSVLEVKNDEENSNSDANEPGTSNESANKIRKVRKAIKRKMKADIATLQAYSRFAEDVSNEDDSYLDLPLVQEENILLEYKRFLEI